MNAKDMLDKYLLERDSLLDDERIKAINSICEVARNEFYHGKPTISDWEYDDLEMELSVIEMER